MPTSTPTPTRRPGPPQDHYRLERPIGPEGQAQASRFYPYGTTATGLYLLHHGVDMENPIGTPVLAVASWTIIVAGSDQATVRYLASALDIERRFGQDDLNPLSRCNALPQVELRALFFLRHSLDLGHSQQCQDRTLGLQVFLIAAAHTFLCKRAPLL